MASENTYTTGQGTLSLAVKLNKLVLNSYVRNLAYVQDVSAYVWDVWVHVHFCTHATLSSWPEYYSVYMYVHVHVCKWNP